MNRIPCRYPNGPLLRVPADLDIDDLASEQVGHVRGARVALAEYDVLQYDFPQLRTDNLVALNPHLQTVGAERRDEIVRSIIDEWLIANAAYVSTVQSAQAVVNTSIGTDGRTANAYRPPRYGRAVVVSLPECGAEDCGQRWRWSRSVGLLDLKGAGVAPGRTPSKAVQSNGLEYLDLAISDFFIKKAIDDIFARSLPTVWTVPVYAVLDLGFDILEGYHGVGPAGLHVRRAHRRRIVPKAPVIEHTVTYEIEKALRRYGLTAATRDLQLHIFRADGQVNWQKGSSAAFAVTDPELVGLSLALLRDRERLTLDRRDVQMARDVSWPPAVAQMVDFGAIRVESNFDCPTIRDFEGPAVEEVLWPHDSNFVQPDAELQLPVETWNRYRLKSLCFDLAERFRHGKISALELRYEVDDRLLDLRSRWGRLVTADSAMTLVK